jgi:predicted  nucleic acid-binding Zn-ribbon protein
MTESEKIQELREELDRLKRSRDKWLSFYRGLEGDIEQLKNAYNSLLDRFQRLENENWTLKHDLEYYQQRARNWQQQAETLQDAKRRDNLSENF